MNFSQALKPQKDKCVTEKNIYTYKLMHHVGWSMHFYNMCNSFLPYYAILFLK